MEILQVQPPGAGVVEDTTRDYRQILLASQNLEQNLEIGPFLTPYPLNLLHVGGSKNYSMRTTQCQNDFVLRIRTVRP